MRTTTAVHDLLTQQGGLIATWQMVGAGCTLAQARTVAENLRPVNDGVFASGHAGLTTWQRWKAATLTSPGTWLSHWSAAALHGFVERDRLPTTVTRSGSGGRAVYDRGHRHLGTLRVFRTTRLGGDARTVRDIPVLGAPRTLIDLAGTTSTPILARLVRDALRLRIVTPSDLHVALACHRGRRGVAALRAISDEFAPLGAHRSRSDAEVLALALFTAAGLEAPAHNVRIANEEADFTWVSRRLILEIDGPSFHEFPTIDARKQSAWERAGWVVRRRWSDDVYDRPDLVLRDATTPPSPLELATIAQTRGPADVLTRLIQRRPPSERSATPG